MQENSGLFSNPAEGNIGSLWWQILPDFSRKIFFVRFFFVAECIFVYHYRHFLMCTMKNLGFCDSIRNSSRETKFDLSRSDLFFPIILGSQHVP